MKLCSSVTQPIESSSITMRTWKQPNCRPTITSLISALNLQRKRFRKRRVSGARGQGDHLQPCNNSSMTYARTFSPNDRQDEREPSDAVTERKESEVGDTGARNLNFDLST